tara:strand:- start:31 stop:195 length:165 start_codon:yes stop_codon:yes gene_type:complete
MSKCKKCKSDNLDFRSNYEWGEEWNPKKEDNIILCNDCGYEEDDNNNINEENKK